MRLGRRDNVRARPHRIEGLIPGGLDQGGAAGYGLDDDVNSKTSYRVGEGFSLGPGQVADHTAWLGLRCGATYETRRGSTSMDANRASRCERTSWANVRPTRP